MSMSTSLNAKYSDNQIVKAIIETGRFPNLKFAKEVGLGYVALSGFIMGNESPIDCNGDLRPEAQSLCDFLGLPADELWTKAELKHVYRSDIIDQLIIHETMDKESKTPEMMLMERQQNAALNMVMNNGLSQNEARVMRLRSGLNYDDTENRQELTLQETGKAIGLTAERVRQIESKAQRKMRHPSRGDMLRLVSINVEIKSNSNISDLSENFEYLPDYYKKSLINTKINANF